MTNTKECLQAFGVRRGWGLGKNTWPLKKKKKIVLFLFLFVPYHNLFNTVYSLLKVTAFLWFRVTGRFWLICDVVCNNRDLYIVQALGICLLPKVCLQWPPFPQVVLASSGTVSFPP